MSRLGMLLALEDGSRLTDVAIYPLHDDHEDAARSASAPPQGTVYLHILTPDTEVDPSSLAGAVSSFLPTALASIAGYRPDGSTWFATAHWAPDDVDRVNAGPAADAAHRRALNLTGTRAGRFRGFALVSHMLAAAYDRSGDVSGWPVDDLFLGLAVELATEDLVGVVDEVNEGSAEGMTRREVLWDLLDEWSAE